MELIALRTFQAVVEEGGILAASRKLNTVQSNVTGRIRKLEEAGVIDRYVALLKPEALAHAMTERRQPGTFRMQQGYDHSYFFVQTFMGDHMRWHAEQLA